MRITAKIPDYISEETPEAVTARFAEIFYSELTELWRRTLLPAMRRSSPHRSGRLKRSMRIWREGNTLVLGFDRRGFYWVWQDGLKDKYQRMAASMIPKLADRAFNIAKEKTGL